MKIFRLLYVIMVSTMSSISVLGMLNAAPVESKIERNEGFNLYLIQEETDESLVVKSIISSQSSNEDETLDSCNPGELDLGFVIKAPGPGFAITVNSMPAPDIDAIEPTTTVDLVFEKIDLPFNEIPGGIRLLKLLEDTLGDDAIFTDDPDHENRVIVTLPALTVEESHDILCNTFDMFIPPRVLVRKFGFSTLISIDTDLVKWENTPYLQVHKIEELRLR